MEKITVKVDGGIQISTPQPDRIMTYSISDLLAQKKGLENQLAIVISRIDQATVQAKTMGITSITNQII